MKKLLILVWIAAALLGLTACNGWIKNDYLSVTPHVEQPLPSSQIPEEEPLPVATNRNELRGTVLGFIRDWTEHGKILVEHYDGDINADLAETIQYATQEDPIGAYAVDFADAELFGSEESGSIEISIVFRRSAAEIDSIVTVNGNNSAYSKIQNVLVNYDTALTLRIRNYRETDFAAYISEYCLEHPDQVLAVPDFSAEIYPDEGETRILELHFSYPDTKDEMRLKQNSVNTILTSASSYISSGKDEYEKIVLLYRFLCGRFDYTVAEEEPTMPAYNLLCDGLAHCRSFSSVFFAECSNANIQCLLVSGMRGGKACYWNMVRLNEQYYYVDLMRSIELGEKEIRLLSTEEMLELGYVWDSASYPATPTVSVLPAEDDLPGESSEAEPTVSVEPTQNTAPPETVNSSNN